MRLSLRQELSTVTVAGAVLTLLIAAGPTPPTHVLAWLRVALGLVFLLLVPGYFLQAALFSRVEDLDITERAALAVGLSLAMVPPVILVINALPWGIQLWPMVIGWGGTISIVAVLSWVRRRRLPYDQQALLAFTNPVDDVWRPATRTQRWLLAGVMGCLVVALVAAVLNVVVPAPSRFYTEFFVLSTEGTARDYPRWVDEGQAQTLLVGVTNRERAAMTYRAELRRDETVVASTGWFAVPRDERIETPLTFQLGAPRGETMLALVLYREDVPAPYRTLRLFVVVEPAS